MPLTTPKSAQISSSQTSIHAYSQINKPGLAAKKTKLESQQLLKPCRSASSQKRKASPDLESAECRTATKRQRRQAVATTPLQAKLGPTKNATYSSQSLPTPDSATGREPGLRRQLCPTHCANPSTSKSSTGRQRKDAPSLPAPLQAVSQLYCSLLRALSLHFAHHGTVSPAPLSTILPSASKIWGKRAIHTDDVRQCWTILGPDETPSDSGLQLWDYGKGGICFELANPMANDAGSARVGISRAIDEESLQRVFDDALAHAWRAWRTKSPRAGSYPPRDGDQSEEGLRLNDTEEQAQIFLSSLPETNIPAHPSLSKSRTATSINLGQRRLDALLKTPRRSQKHPRDAPIPSPLTPAQTPTSTSTSTSTPSNPTPRTPKDRTSALLSRLLQKHPRTPISPQPTTTPTTAAINVPLSQNPHRAAALQKLPSIIRTLTLLSSQAGGRRAFGVAELVRLVRESAPGGHVVEGGVVVCALGLLAGVDMDVGVGAEKAVEGGAGQALALAGEFVKVVRVGAGVLGVVVDERGRPAGLEERVGEMLGGGTGGLDAV